LLSSARSSAAFPPCPPWPGSIEAKLAAARQRVDALTQAVLAKAFLGELVPTEPELARREDRDYEPAAAALLERVRAERAATPKPGRRRKG
jgi:type I restriction enzyme S subunit